MTDIFEPDINSSFIQSVATANTGGGTMIDIITLRNRLVLILNEDAIALYPSLEAFNTSPEDTEIAGFHLPDLQEADAQLVNKPAVDRVLLSDVGSVEMAITLINQQTAPLKVFKNLIAAKIDAGNFHFAQCLLAQHARIA